MRINTLQSFNQLIDRIETAPTLKFAHKQLACISKLVFFSGVQPPEIPKISIRDVLDNGGNVIRVIHKFGKPIFLTDEGAVSIAAHIDEMGNRNPALVKRRSPLFPSYPNTRKLARHYKKFGTSYIEIHHAGIHYYYQTGFTDRDFRNNTGLKLNSSDILALLLETSRVEFKVSFPVRLRSTGSKMNVHRMNFYSRFFELAEEQAKVRKDGIVQERRYRVFFNTLLGELFVNNLLAKFNDRIGLDFYALPDSAQLFYRRKLLHNDHSPIEFKLETIAEAAGLIDANLTNLINTIEKNILEPLKNREYISSFERSRGLDGIRYIIKRVKDKSSKPMPEDGGSVK